MSLLISISSLLKYENLALWIVFGLVIVVLLWSILRGSWRGWAYGTYRLIFYTAAITALFLTLNLVVEAVGNIDLSKWISKSISVSLNGKTISANVTSISGTIQALITDAVMQFDLGIDPDHLLEFASGLTTSLLKIGMICFYGVALWLIGKPICWLLWHIAFKYIIPKDQRMLTKEEWKANDALPKAQRKKTCYKKVRGVSMAEELVINAVLMCMVAVPLSGTINSIANSFNKSTEDSNTTSNTVTADNETLTTVQTALDTYQNSVFSKVFFNWTVNQNNRSWDTELLSMLSQANITSTVSTSVVDVLSEVGGVAKDVIESGLLSKEGTTFDKVYLLLTTQYGVNILSSLAKSNLVTAILPMAVEVALNMETVKTYIGNSLGIDYYSYNWSATVSELSGIITDLQSSDVFDFFTDVDGTAHFDADTVSSLFTEKTAVAMDEIFDRFSKHPDEKNIFNDLITVFLVNNALNASDETTGLSLDQFLPDTEGCEYTTDETTGRKYVSKLNQAYEDLSLGDELKIVYSSLCDINALDDRLTALVVSSLVDKDKELDTNVLLDIIVNHIDGVTEAIVGKDNPEDGETCLMDCSFLTYGMPAITDLISSTINTSLNVEVDLTSVKEELFSTSLPFATRQANAKSEMKGILDIMKNFVDTDDVCKEFITDLDAMPGIVYNPDGTFHSIEPALIDGFITVAEGIDDSKILGAVVPAVADKLLGDNESLKSLGIDGINTDVDDFGHELASLLKVAKNCMPLIEFIMSEASDLSGASATELSTVISGLADYHDQIVILLNGITTNKLINDENNTAYRGIIENLMGNLLGKTITLPATIDPAVENQVIADLIYGLGTYTTPAVLEALMGSGSISLSSFEGVDFAAILAPLDSSEVFGTVIAEMLDSAILPMLGSDASEMGVSFTNVTSWVSEGQALNALIKFGNEVGDISNIDLFNSDPEVISGLIKALSQSQIFNTADGYEFGEFFHTMIANSVGSAITFFEDRNPVGTTNVEKTQTIKNAMCALSQSEWNAEADAIGDIIANFGKVLNGKDLSSGIEITDLKASAVRGLLYSLANSETLGRPVTYHLYAQIGSSMKSAGLDIGEGTYGYMNLDWLWDAFDDASKTNLLNEMDHLADFFDVTMDPCYGLIDEDGNFTTTGIDISKTSGHYLLAPVTEALATSIVFNTVPDGSTTPTACEAMITQFIISSGLYSAIDDSKRSEVLSYVQSVSPDTQEVSKALASNRLSETGPWIKECETLGDLGDSIVNLSESLNDFNPSSIFNAKNGELLPEPERLAKRQALYEVITAVNDSKILYRFLPEIIEIGIDNVASSLNAGSVTPNYYYMGKGSSAQPYGDDEINNLVWIIYYSASADLSVDSIYSLDADSTTEILSCLAKSHIFNSCSSGEDTTFFQAVMGSVFSKQEVAGCYYYASSPKDNPTYNADATYTDAKSKAIKTSGTLFPTVSATASCDEQINLDLFTGDSYSLKTFIKAIQANPEGYAKIMNGSLLSLDSSIIKTLGKELSNNELLSDILVNALAKTFAEKFSGYALDMLNANPYYCYWLSDDGYVKANTTEADYSKAIGDDEIDLLAEFAPLFTENSSLFDNLGSTAVTNETINVFKNLLTLLNSSYIFNLGGAWDDMGTKAMTSWQSDLTVFEQAYGLIVKASSLSSLNYDAAFDSAKYGSADMKLNSYIKAFSASTLSSEHSGNWLAEINALTNDDNGGGLMKKMLDLGVIGDSLSMGSIDLLSYSPDKISVMLKALNGVDIIKDVLPYQMRSLFNDKIDFDAYSTYTQSLTSTGTYDSSVSLGKVGIFSSLTIRSSDGDVEVKTTSDGLNWSSVYTGSVGSEGVSVSIENTVAFKIVPSDESSKIVAEYSVDTANFFMSQEGYGKTGGAIDSLIELFNALYGISGNSYPSIDANDPESMETLLGVFENVMSFIDDENGFYTNAYDANGKLDASDTSYLARDVFMRNLLKVSTEEDGNTYTLDIGRYFKNGYSDIYDIFESDSYDVSVEGSWFKNHLTNIEKSEFAIGGHVGSIVVDGHTLPGFHSMLETLAGSKTEGNSSYVLESNFSSVGSSLFGLTIVNGMAKDLIAQIVSYAKGGSYFKEAALNDPNDDAVRQSSSEEAVSTYSSSFESFDVVNSTLDRATIIRLLTIVEAYGFKALANSSSDVAVFKSCLLEMDDVNQTLGQEGVNKFFYNAAIYEYMLNRNIYHAAITYPVTEPEVSIPNAFASGFTFASVTALAE